MCNKAGKSLLLLSALRRVEVVRISGKAKKISGVNATAALVPMMKLGKRRDVELILRYIASAVLNTSYILEDLTRSPEDDTESKTIRTFPAEANSSLVQRAIPPRLHLHHFINPLRAIRR